MFILASDSAALFQYIKNCWSSYNGGGEFFLHTSFTVLASAVVSSRIREYLITPPNEKKAALRKEIRETQKIINREKQSFSEEKQVLVTAFDECIRDIDNQHEYLKTWIQRIEMLTKILCWVLLSLLFWLIITKQVAYGFFPLFSLLPLLIARTLQRILYWNANNTYEAQRKRIIAIKKLRQKQHAEEQRKADCEMLHALEKLFNSQTK